MPRKQLNDRTLVANKSRFKTPADAALRMQEKRFRALATASAYSIFSMSPDWSELWQLESGGLLADTAAPNRNWLQQSILPEDQPAVLTAIHDAIRAKKIFDLEHRVRRTDGTIGWIYSHAVPLLDESGEIEEWFGAATDVTAHKQNEETCSRMAAIVESADDVIYSKDMAGTITSWNPAAQRIFGYRPEEIIGKNVRCLVPGDLQAEEDMIFEKIRRGERIEHYETMRLRKDGTRLELSVTISPVRDSGGRIIGGSTIARDISGRRQMERTLLQTEKLAAAGRMAAAVAHEINNPLEAILNLVFLARQLSSSPEESRAYLSTAEKELQRVAHLAQQTLGFHRGTSQPIELAVDKLLDDLLEIYEPKFRSSGITVVRNFEQLDPVVAGRGELLQVFSNLIANAIDSMPHGGQISIYGRATSRGSKSGVEVTIQDTGYGIPPENLERAFEPFFTTKGEMGTGIGLWVSKQLMEKNRGEITLSSQTKGKSTGTSVTVFLPGRATSIEAAAA